MESARTGEPRELLGDAELEEVYGDRKGQYADVLSFMRLMRAVDHEVRRISKGMRSSLGVTGSELLALRTVGRRPGLSAGELARLMHLNASTLTGVLERLVQRGLLERGTDENDRRRDVLHLTAAGKGVDKLRSGTVEAHFQRALAQVSAAQISTTANVLRTLARELTRR